MEPLDPNWFRLVLDIPTLGQLLPMYMAVSIGIALVVGGLGAVSARILEEPGRRAFVISAIVAFLIVFLGLVGFTALIRYA